MDVVSYTCTNTGWVSNETVWSYWCSNTTTSATTDVTWSAWNQAYNLTATSATATNGTVWRYWNHRYVRTATVTTASTATVRTLPYAEPTPAQRAATLERERERELRKARANDRADRLLMECITPAQRESLIKNGFFDVEVGGKTYRIKRGTHGNVVQMVDGREKRRFCIQPDGVPTADAMLSQKLLLESDEAAFLRIANRTELS